MREAFRDLEDGAEEMAAILCWLAVCREPHVVPEAVFRSAGESARAGYRRDAATVVEMLLMRGLRIEPPCSHVDHDD